PVDEAACPPDDRLQVGDHRFAGEEAPREREIGRRRAVERTETADRRAPEPLGPAPGPLDESRQFVPGPLSLIRERTYRHGMEPVAPATYDDRVTIATPEGVDLTLTLAGVGSRFASAVVDILIQTLIIVALTIVVGVAGPGYGAAVLAIVSFAVVFGYDV